MKKIPLMLLILSANFVFAQVPPGKLPPQPEFGEYTLGMKREKAIQVSPSNYQVLEKGSLGLSGIIFYRNKLKWALWFYKGKLQGILIRGKIKKKFRQQAVKGFKKQYGDGGYTFEYGFPHYYWYFFRKTILYTIEIKYFLIDIHYSITDTGKGPKPYK